MNPPRDQVYEYLRHLDFESIKNLCSTNRYYHDLCQTEMFDKLIRSRYFEMINTVEYKIKQQERKISQLTEGQKIIYDLGNINTIEIHPHYINEYALTYQQSFLFRLLVQGTRFSRLSHQDWIDYAGYLDQMDGINTYIQDYQTYGVIALIPFWIQENAPGYDFDNYGNYITMSIENPTPEQIYDLLTMMWEQDPPTIIYDGKKV